VRAAADDPGAPEEGRLRRFFAAPLTAAPRVLRPPLPPSAGREGLGRPPGGAPGGSSWPHRAPWAPYGLPPFTACMHTWKDPSKAE
jgi:hypothetical protein